MINIRETLETISRIEREKAVLEERKRAIEEKTDELAKEMAKLNISSSADLDKTILELEESIEDKLKVVRGVKSAGEVGDVFANV